VSSRPPAINGSVPIDCAGEPKQCHPLSHLPRTSPATNRRPTLRPVMLLCFGCPVWLLVVPMYSALNLSRPRHYPHLLSPRVIGPGSISYSQLPWPRRCCSLRLGNRAEISCHVNWHDKLTYHPCRCCPRDPPG